MKFSLDWLSDFWGLEPGSMNEDFISRLAATANEIGLEIGQVERIGEDRVLDADVTPNRPDAMNHRGFARDLAAALALPFDNGRFSPALPEGSERVERLAHVSVEVPERCRRFAVRAIRNVSPAASGAKWLRRMAALGLKSIDAVVDATNISVWGLGQPLHAFDADKVPGGRFVIRLARKGEKLACLDGIERELHPEDVVVADERRAISLAGVIGGADTAITPGVTRNVFLEAAWWDPISVRRTARRHGLHTDASHRYERGADIEAIPEGLALAASLILEQTGGELSAGTVDEYPRPFERRRVCLRESRLVALSGFSDFSTARAAGILERLGFSVEIRKDQIEAEVPSWRPDVSIEEDLIEEAVRIRGYSEIPSELPPAERLSAVYLSDGPLREGSNDERAPREIDDEVADQAREAGFFESMSFPFAGDSPDSSLGGNLLGKAGFRATSLLVANPLDATRPALRRAILPGLLEAASLNHRNGRRSIALFEVGRVWDRDAPPGADPAETESRHFAAVLGGAAPDEFPIREAGVLDGKGMLERVIEAVTGVPPELVAAWTNWLAPGSGLEIRSGGARIGFLGRLADLSNLPALPSPTVVVELDLGGLPRPRRRAGFQDYSRFPAAEVDVTIACRPEVAWGEIAQTVRDARLENCESAVLSKLFEDPAPPVTRNFTVRLSFRARDRTLSQEEVNRERDRLLEMLKEKFGVTT